MCVMNRGRQKTSFYSAPRAHVLRQAKTQVFCLTRLAPRRSSQRGALIQTSLAECTACRPHRSSFWINSCSKSTKMETHFLVTPSMFSREPFHRASLFRTWSVRSDVHEAPRYQCRREHARDWRSGGNTVHKPTQEKISVGSNGHRAGVCADACAMCSGRHRSVAICKGRADPYGPKRLDAQNTTGRVLTDSMHAMVHGQETSTS